jgi:WD40 repeat protein
MLYWCYIDYRLSHSLMTGPEQAQVSSLAFDSGNVLASVLTEDFLSTNSFEHAINLWDTRSGALLDTLYGHASYVFSVAFNREGLLASGSSDDIRVWNVTDRDKGHQKLRSVLRSSEDTFVSIAFYDNVLASGSSVGSLRLWNASTGDLMRTLCGPMPAKIVSSVAFNSDGAVLASGDSFGCIQLWDVATGALLRTMSSAHQSPVTSIAFSHGRVHMLASGSWDFDIKLWSTESGELLRILHANGSYVTSLAFRSDNLLASSSWANSIQLWDINSGRLLHTLSGQAENVKSLAFRSTDQLLASGDLKGGVSIWTLN